MSATIFYKVRVVRDPEDPNVVRAFVLSQATNVFPKPLANEEARDELFAEDVSEAAGLERLATRITSLARSADGFCLRERGRCYEGPAYYRLWQRRLARLDVGLPPPDLAAVRYGNVAKPEAGRARISFKAYQSRRINFTRPPLVSRSTGQDIQGLRLVGWLPNSEKFVRVEYFTPDGSIVWAGAERWSRLYTLLRKNPHNDAPGPGEAAALHGNS